MGGENSGVEWSVFQDSRGGVLAAGEWEGLSSEDWRRVKGTLKSFAD